MSLGRWTSVSDAVEPRSRQNETSKLSYGLSQSVISHATFSMLVEIGSKLSTAAIWKNFQ